MKKLTKILSGLACLALAASLIACKTPEDPTGGEAPGGNKDPAKVDKPAEENSSIWDGAEVVEFLAGQKASWSDGGAIKMPSAYTKRIQVGSKVIFELEPTEDVKGDSYLQFHIENGKWNACGVNEYFAADGSKLNVTEDENHAGVFNSDSYEKAVVAYFVVTEENIDTLKAGFAFQGNLQVKKVAITNLAAVDPNEAAKLLEVSNCKAYTATFTSSTSDDLKFGYLLQIDNDGTQDATGLRIVVSDLILSVKVGDAEAKEINMGEMTLVPNQWCDPKYSKSDCRKVILDNGVPVSVSEGTKVTVQVVSAKIDNKEKAGEILFAFQQEGGNYAMFAADNEIYKPAFAANED